MKKLFVDSTESDGKLSTTTVMAHILKIKYFTVDFLKLYKFNFILMILKQQML